PITFQWQLNGTNVVGATNGLLMITNAQAADAGTYRVLIRNPYSATNLSADLVVTPSSPIFLAQPASAQTFTNGAITLACSAKGSDPLSYQWQFNGIDISGATNSEIVFAGAHLSDAGLYRVVVSNTYGVLISSNASLAIGPTMVVQWNSRPELAQQLTPPLD